MKKRILCLVLALLMLAAIPAVAFADDSQISFWAYDSVYFMASKGIINVIGNNLFAPRNVTDAQTSVGYANATREQALLIAVRMVLKLEIEPAE